MDYMEIANSFPMWIAAALAVVLVLFQSFIFVRKSLVDGKKIGLTNKQMKSAMRSSAISAFGPSLVILAGMISLLISLGGPISWMRLSFIGSVMFELMAAGFGTGAMGVKLGSDAMTGIVYANAVWTMILGAIGWLLFTALFTHKLDKVREKMAGGNKKLIPIISVAAMLGAFAQINSSRILQFDKGTLALVVGAVCMIILQKMASNGKNAWIKEWALTISMFTGMLVAIIA